MPTHVPQIQQIKDALQEKEGIDVKQIRLIHGGKQLCVGSRWTGARARARGGLDSFHAPPPPAHRRSNHTETLEQSKIEPGAQVSTRGCLRVCRAGGAVATATLSDVPRPTPSHRSCTWCSPCAGGGNSARLVVPS